MSEFTQAGVCPSCGALACHWTDPPSSVPTSDVLIDNLDRLVSWCRAQDANATIWLHAVEARDRINTLEEGNSGLLEALIQCRSVLGTVLHETQDSTAARVLTRRIATASAAIAKARGLA